MFVFLYFAVQVKSENTLLGEKNWSSGWGRERKRALSLSAKKNQTQGCNPVFPCKTWPNNYFYWP